MICLFFSITCCSTISISSNPPKYHRVQFYEVLASKTKIYLVLELVTGGELFALLVKERGFGEEKARFYFRQLVEGIKCCHEKGICHRDLKPENLLLDEQGLLKISDFGLSSIHINNNGETTLTSSKMMHTTVS